MTDSGRNRTPYSGIRWEKVHRIAGTTHMHCENQAELTAYTSQGLEFAAVSNYYPSAPWFPLASVRENTFKLRQKSFLRQGKLFKEEIDFRKERSLWEASDREKYLPFPEDEGEKIFTDIPAGLIEAPNAEHAWFAGITPYLHVCSPGCTLHTSHFDRARKYGLCEHGFQLGFPLPWKEGFKALLDTLIVPDGGGLVIAHPHESHFSLEELCGFLDFDSRVLGIEVYNHNSSCTYNDSAETEWDYILSTNRQCFGFFVQDHLMKGRVWKGRNILLAEERTMESCLQACRKGNFYGAVLGTGYAFDYINFDGRTLTARCNREGVFQLCSRCGVIMDSAGKEFSFTVPENERSKHIYLRLMAWEPDTWERLYTQPVMLLP